MTVANGPVPKTQFNQNGIPLSGGNLFTYAAGTTTKLATYTDSTGNTENTNPIILDSNGQCDIFLTTTLLYKYVLSPANDTDPPTNPFWTEDNIKPMGSSILLNGAVQSTTLAASSGSSIVGYIPPGTGAIAETVQNELQRTINLANYCSDLTGATSCLTGIQNAMAALGSSGGEILVPPGSILGISGVLSIGNGTTTTASTQNGVYFRALGGGNDPFGNSGCQIKWLGSSGGTMVQFLGPMLGGGLQGNWTLNGNSLASNGLIINHAADCDFGNIKITGCSGIFLEYTTQCTTDFYGGCRNNHMRSISISSLPSGATGLSMDGAVKTISGDVLQNAIDLIDISNVAQNGATAIYLGWADFNYFPIVDITGTTGGTSVGLQLQGSSQSYVPFMNKFGCYANNMGETTYSGQHPYGNYIEIYDYADSGGRWPTAEGLSGVGYVYSPSGGQVLGSSFGFKGYGFDTTTPSVPSTGSGNAVTNTNPYPVSIYMTPATGSNVPGTHIIDQHGTDTSIGTPLYLKLAPGAKVYFAIAAPGSWTWYGEVF